MSNSGNINTNNNKVLLSNEAMAVRAYVTDDSNVYHDNDTVFIDITHNNLQQKHIEIRFSKKYDTILSLRTKIYQQTGTSYQYQHLHIYDDCNIQMANIPPNSSSQYDSYKIGYFCNNNNNNKLHVHCIDINPYSISKNGGLENTNLIQKFTLSDEEYKQKQSKTLHAWKQNQLQIDPTFTYKKHAEQHSKLQYAIQCCKQGLPLPSGFQIDNKTGKVVAIVSNDDENNNSNNEYGIESVSHVQMNSRCQIHVGQRRGIISYIGQVPELDNNNNNNNSYWVGITLDEPVGKHNGTIQDKQYFIAPDNHGIFVRGKHVEIGNFPERDIFDELSSSEDEL